MHFPAPKYEIQVARHDLKGFAHELGDVLEPQAADNAGTTKCDRDPVGPGIGNAKGVVGRIHDGLVGRILVVDGRTGRDQVVELRVLGIAAETDSGDELIEVVGDVGLGHNRRSNFVGEMVELVEKHIVEDSEADRATNVANGQCDRGNSSNQIGRANNLRNQGAWDNDRTDTDVGQRDDRVHSWVNVVGAGDGHGAHERRHEDTPADHEPADATSRDENQTQVNAGAGNNAEANGKRTDTNLHGVVAIDVEDLSRPEQKHDEKVASAKKGDEQNRYHGGLAAGEDASWDHGMGGKLHLVEEEDGDEGTTQEEGNENVDTGPNML